MVHYGDYLQLDRILDAQHPESDKLGEPAHDEMLFIVIHQAYELWFKQLLFETGSVIGIMQQPALNDNSPQLQTVVHRLSRCSTILKVLVHQIDIMETMTPMDFLDFRDKLRPASGFQSWQFKLLEARLGLKYEHRFGQQYYVSQLRQPEIDIIKAAEGEPSLLQLLNSWLERMPFLDENTARHFWSDYRDRYQQSLADPEKINGQRFDAMFFGAPGPATAAQPSPSAGPSSCPFGQQQAPNAEAASPNLQPETTERRSLSPSACRSALFIMLYRCYPLLQLPFQVLHQLLE